MTLGVGAVVATTSVTPAALLLVEVLLPDNTTAPKIDIAYMNALTERLFRAHTLVADEQPKSNETKDVAGWAKRQKTLRWNLFDMLVSMIYQYRNTEEEIEAAFLAMRECRGRKLKEHEFPRVNKYLVWKDEA